MLQVGLGPIGVMSKGAVVLVCGKSGIGKSTLVTQVVYAAHRNSFPYLPNHVPPEFRAMQTAACYDLHERSVLADWYEAQGYEDLAATTRELHCLFAGADKTTSTVLDRVRQHHEGTRNNWSIYPRIEVVPGHDVDYVISQARAMKPKILGVDTLQLMSTSKLRSKPGTASQLRASAEILINFARSTGTTTFLCASRLGLARYSVFAEMQLEHLVDSVFVLTQSQLDSALRVLQCSKNRYGHCQDTILRARIGSVLESNAVNLHGVS